MPCKLSKPNRRTKLKSSCANEILPAMCTHAESVGPQLHGQLPFYRTAYRWRKSLYDAVFTMRTTGSEHDVAVKPRPSRSHRLRAMGRGWVRVVRVVPMHVPHKLFAEMRHAQRTHKYTQSHYLMDDIWLISQVFVLAPCSSAAERVHRAKGKKGKIAKM